jgi:hypothetical protein
VFDAAFVNGLDDDGFVLCDCDECADADSEDAVPSTLLDERA